jgi:hypothetical protein
VRELREADFGETIEVLIAEGPSTVSHETGRCRYCVGGNQCSRSRSGARRPRPRSFATAIESSAGTAQLSAMSIRPNSAGRSRTSPTWNDLKSRPLVASLARIGYDIVCSAHNRCASVRDSSDYQLSGDGALGEFCRVAAPFVAVALLSRLSGGTGDE